MRIRRRVALGGLAAAVGLAVGVLGFTFVYAKGYSYLTNDPAACANCHVMNDQYAGWQRGSHRSVATCNDCHTPEGFVGKYRTKAQNGFWHSFYFTFGGFPEPIRIGPRNRAVTEGACRKCHEDLVQAITPFHSGKNQTDCLRCHRDVGHLH